MYVLKPSGKSVKPSGKSFMPSGKRKFKIGVLGAPLGVVDPCGRCCLSGQIGGLGAPGVPVDLRDRCYKLAAGSLLPLLFLGADRVDIIGPGNLAECFRPLKIRRGSAKLWREKKELEAEEAAKRRKLAGEGKVVIASHNPLPYPWLFEKNEEMDEENEEEEEDWGDENPADWKPKKAETPGKKSNFNSIKYIFSFF